MDEVSSGKREQLKSYLNPFVKDFGNKTICTSRIVGYTSFLENTKEMEIVPFNYLQTSEYIKLWFKNAEAAEVLEDKTVSANNLINELKSKPQIQGLCQNPLLLSLVCSLYQTKGLELPARKTQVYEKAVNYMLSGWSKDNSRTSSVDGWVESKIELLEFIAYQFSCSNTEVLEIRELKKQIDLFKKDTISSDFKDKSSSDLIEELSNQDGILQKLSEESRKYLFLHRTFQEYFAAAYISEKIKDNKEAGIALFKEHLWEFDWHETLTLVAGLLDDPNLLIKAIINQKDDIFLTLLLLAGRCIAECEENIKLNHLTTKVLNDIYQLWKLHWDRQYIINNIIAIAKTNSHIRQKLILDIEERTVSNRFESKIAEVIVKVSHPETVPLLTYILSDSGQEIYDKYIQIQSILALEEIGNFDAIKALTFTLENNQDIDIRMYAAKSLGKLGVDEGISRLSNVIFNSYESGNYDYIEAARKLEEIGNNKAREALRRNLNCGNRQAEILVAEILVEMRDRETIEYLRTKVLSDEFFHVEEASILGKIGDSTGLKNLINHISYNEIPVQNSVIALGEIGSSKSEAVSTLIKVLQTGPQDKESMRALYKQNGNYAQDLSWIRQQAIVALGKIKAPEAVPFIRKAFKNGHLAQILEDAIWSLGQIGTSEALEGLIYGIQDMRLGGAHQAATILFKMGYDEGLQALIKALNYKENPFDNCNGLQKLNPRLAKTAVFGSDYFAKTIRFGSQYLQMDSHYLQTAH
nr:hypothetical protein [Xenococcus sp. MO_188.B8]